jgi:hypothetical protein
MLRDRKIKGWSSPFPSDAPLRDEAEKAIRDGGRDWLNIG